MADGWIKLHRSCLDHWLYTEYRPLTRREAWETMLFTVNYEDGKSLIKGELYECKRGQSLLSLNSWAEKFVWSVQQVRTFFKLLEADKMIVIEGLHYTTRLTICNYDNYQGASTDRQHAANTPLTDRQHAANTPLTTIKEEEEYKNNKKEKNNEEKPIEFFAYEKIANEIFDFFSIDKDHPASQPKLSKVKWFLDELQNKKQIEYFSDAFNDYRIYQLKNPKYKYSFDRFIGDIGGDVFEGCWNKENWKIKIRECTSNPNEIKPIPRTMVY